MPTKLRLPQVEVCKEGKTEPKPLLMVAGGRRVNRNWLCGTSVACSAVWAVDRGAEYCREAGLIPDLYVGDKDSADGEVLRWLVEAGVKRLEFPVGKDRTDLQLALREAGRRFKDVSVLVTGSWGGRFDHLMSAVYSLVSSFKRSLSPWGMADEKEVLLLLQGRGRFFLEFLEAPFNLSLLALSPRCLGVSISGVRWELDHRELRLDEPYAVSNEVLPEDERIGRRVEVSLDKGLLGLYLDFWSETGKEDCPRQPS
ncbi:MAG: thiamine diphosphokinase [Thermovirgaceae bacterium]